MAARTVTTRRSASKATAAPARKTTARKVAPKRVSELDTVERVANLPGIEVHNGYVDRSWPGGHSTYDLYDIAYRKGYNVLNEGPTACGKTYSAEAFAAFNGLRYFAIPNNNAVNNDDLFGRWIPDPSGQTVGIFVIGPITDIFMYGGVLVANELPFLPDRTQSILYQAFGRERSITLQGHKNQVIKAHLGSEADNPCWCNGEDPDCDRKRVLIIADMNPGYQGVRPLNYAVRGRFKIQNTWDYDPAVEAQLVKSQSLQAMVAQLRAEAAKGTYDTPISTAMMIEFEDLSRNLSLPFAVNNFVTHFGVDERASVKLVCDTWSANIESEIEAAFNLSASVEEAAPDADFDPEWGIHGIDWVYEDEAQ